MSRCPLRAWRALGSPRPPVSIQHHSSTYLTSSRLEEVRIAGREGERERESFPLSLYFAGHLYLVYEENPPDEVSTFHHHQVVLLYSPNFLLLWRSPSLSLSLSLSVSVCLSFSFSQPNLVGIITLEDVIEELIGEEIIDETDLYVDVHRRISVARARVQLLRQQQSDPTSTNRRRHKRTKRSTSQPESIIRKQLVRVKTP